MWKLAVFAVASALIIAASWRALRKPATHGFFRFLAWEVIAALVILNVEHWFADPWSPPQLLSWVLLVGSLLLVGSGLHLLRNNGRLTDDGAQPSNYAWENTSQLVDTGIYRYVRHPMYASLLLLTWGGVPQESVARRLAPFRRRVDMPCRNGARRGARRLNKARCSLFLLS